MSYHKSFGVLYTHGGPRRPAVDYSDQANVDAFYAAAHEAAVRERIERAAASRLKSRLYRLRLRFTYPWLLAIVRPQWADFARAGELAKARARER